MDDDDDKSSTSSDFLPSATTGFRRIHMDNAFWPPQLDPSGTLATASPYDYRKGYEKLKSQLRNGLAELRQVLLFLVDLTASHMAHGQRIKDLQSKSCFNIQLLSTQNSTLNTAFKNLRNELDVIAKYYEKSCENIQMLVLNRLNLFKEQYETSLRKDELQVEVQLAQFERYLL